MIFIVLIFLLLTFSGCSQAPAIPEVKAEAGLKPQQAIQLALSPVQEKNIGLLTDTVQERSISTEVSLTGRVQAASPLLAHVYSLVPGQAVQIPVTVGQVITQGQVLAVIRSDDIGQLEGELLQSILQLEQEIREAQVQLNLSKSIYDREEQLFKAKVSAKSEVESASAQYIKDQVILRGLQEKRQAIIQTYQERLSLLGTPAGTAAQVVATRHISPYATIRAPKSGLLVARNINAGELVETSKELFQVADLNTVWLTGDVFEKDIQRVAKGQPVEIRLDSFPGTRFSGKVDLVDAMLDPQTRTLEVRVEVPNPRLLLKPNMFARMRIITGKRLALTIPKSAIQQSGDHLFAYVQTAPNQYEERLIQAIMADSEYVEVLAGLVRGENIVSQGSLTLKGMAQRLSK